MGRRGRRLAGARRKPADALPALPGRVRGGAHPGPRALQGGRRRLLTISGGRVLAPEGGFERRDLAVADGRIVDAVHGGETLDASGLLVLPGMVDIHGDAFERQIMPRPGVHFPLDVALLDSDRQMAANGIATAYHAVTWSWEPGLRGRGTLVALMAALEALAGRLMVDTRLHLRIETFNLDAVDELCAWMGAGKVDLLAFNDHFEEICEQCRDARKIGKYAERAGLAHDAFLDLLEEVRKGAPEVPAAMRRVAAAAEAAGVVRLAHDEETLEDRSLYRSLGARVSEFPEIAAVAREAVRAGEAVVFGAPNVLRGGSHTGSPGAAEMVREGLCTVLASDYYYPAMLLAPFRLAEDGVLPLEEAWPLVSANPARAAGLNDRGALAEGMRADILLVDPSGPVPRPAAAPAGGRLLRFGIG
ncbi:MAG: alpha-D-ribose 1-methylphosphonate 5-triphosphate diphosphatase [Alphaproteobacteria bacterium]|nr:alpha-D-ribose 1-methylphosphonate 5-triphosphate diphosphatase [Alphaproteobacteria bacterium]